MIVTGIVQDIGKIVDESVAEAIEQLTYEEIQDEPSLTSSFFGTVRNKINARIRARGYDIRAYIVRGVGRGAPEKKYGADICIVFDVDTKDYKLRKGILIQAKMDKALRASIPKTGHPIPEMRVNSEYKRLKCQCEKMLDLSPDSFVIIYSTNNFSVVPAVSIVSIEDARKGIFRLYGKRVSAFFKEFIMCFIGDRKLGGINDIKDLYDSIDKLVIEIRDEGT